MAVAPLETSRLVLSPLAPGDAEALHAFLSDEETMRFWHTPRHASAAETQAEIEAMCARPGAAWWAIRPRGEGPAIGFVGYHSVAAAPAGFGYLLGRGHWRRGFATEAARAALAHGFGPLSLERVELWTHERNLASRGLAEKLGFSRRSAFGQAYPGTGPAETIVYGVTAQEWRGEPGAARAPAWIAGLEPVLLVRDVAATAAFYCEKLGFRVAHAAGDPPVFAVISREEWSFRGARIQLARGEGAAGPLYVRVGGDIDALCAELRARGAAIRSGPETQPWRMREFSVEDCNGVLLRFGTPA